MDIIQLAGCTRGKNKLTLPNGITIHWEDNGVGGRRYYSDEVGFGVLVWDTCLVRKETLEAVILIEEIFDENDNSWDRPITDLRLLEKVIKDSGFNITEVVCGGAKGVDDLGRKWAHNGNNGIPVKLFVPSWNDLVTPPVKIKVNKFGKEYNALAGLNRNTEMAAYADDLIAIWDGESPGTKHMINTAKRLKLKIYVHIIV